MTEVIKFPVRQVHLPESLIRASIRAEQERVITEIAEALREDIPGKANPGALRKDHAVAVGGLETKFDLGVSDTLRVAARLLIAVIILLALFFG